MALFQWMARKLMTVMGYAYVWLDKRVKYTDEEVSEVLGLKIDKDLQTSSRYELCRVVEKEFKVPKNTLDLTQHAEDTLRSTADRELKKPSKLRWVLSR